jgi:cell division protein FtsB
MSQKPLLELLGVQDAASAKSAVDALYLEITDLNAEIDDLSYKRAEVERQQRSAMS